MIWPLLMLLQVDADDYATCNQAEADKGIQSEMNICAYADYKEADDKLNAQWKQTMALMKKRDAATGHDDGRPGNAQLLLDAQLAWLKYRDAHCSLDGYIARGGSMEPLLVSTCKTSLTEKRTQELKEALVEY